MKLRIWALKKKKKLVYTARLLPERFYPFTVSLDNNATVCVSHWSPCWHWIPIFKTSLLFFANFESWKTYPRFNLHFYDRLWAWNTVLLSKNSHLFCVDVFVLFFRSELLPEWLSFPTPWSLTTAGSLSWLLPISEPELIFAPYFNPWFPLSPCLGPLLPVEVFFRFTFFVLVGTSH